MRLHALTGLRFFAALAVVIYHAGRHVEPQLTHYAGLGNTGVTFFFVLSGFVLAWTARQGDRAGHFYWRRFARVWPLHLVMTLAAVLLMLSWGEGMSLPILIVTVLLVQAWMPPNSWHYGYNQVSWSLSCEAFFYATFPWLAPRLLDFPRRARVVLAVVPAAMVMGALLVLTIAPARSGFLLFVNPAYRLGEFVVGICLATLLRSGWRPPLSIRTSSLFVVGSYAIGMGIANTLFVDPLALPAVVGDLLMLPGLALLISAVAAHELGGGVTWLAYGPVVLLGEWSFALYLVHDLVLRSLAHVRAPWVPKPALLVVAVLLAVGLSWLLHVVVERPVERYLRSRMKSQDWHVADHPNSIAVNAGDVAPRG